MYLNKFDLQGRSAFITGGGRGIGLCAAEALLEAGARVTISDIDAGLLDAAKAKLQGKGEVETAVLDIADSAAVAEVARAANARGAIDILIANAGIAWPDTAAEEMPDAAWLKVIDVDLNGAYWCCREFGRAMLERGRGAIVTVGSMSGLISNKPQRQAHYNAAKAGVHHLTKSLAGEWAARGVRVNSVAPTYVGTEMTNRALADPKLASVWLEMTPMHRVAAPDEIASAILFLASDAASAITGSVLVVDCGYTVW
jgi:NAD(P)-dependent dehydrogenase (short-subunit alcohol dehydrogenase family)